MKKNLISALYGVFVTLALPPVYLLPLAIIGLSGFLLLIRECENAKRAFTIGWWFGFGHFATGLYWICIALLVDAKNFAWLIPFAVLGIPAVVAIYTAFISLITWHAAKRLKDWELVIVFACVWTAIEMLRGYLFTGFPWNLIGYIWTSSLSMLQFVSVAGIWGLSLLTVIVFSMPSVFFLSPWKIKSDLSLRIAIPFIVSSIFAAFIFAYGYMRLDNHPTEFVKDVKLRIVQANIDQNLKWEEEWRDKTVQKYFDMTTSKGFDKITHVIWPETALPFALTDRDQNMIKALAEIAPKKGALITGALRIEHKGNYFPENFYNSLAVITHDAKLYSLYNKKHLVPFGEYVPFSSILPLQKITNGMVDFTEGTTSSTITAPNFPPFSGLVCYEAIFPGNVVDKNTSSKALVNVTNDAWYGNTSGPYQHFEMARTRAVEEGKPLIRAANNGISAVIDSYGRIIGKTKLAETAVLDTLLPANINNSTIYGSYRNLLIILSIVVLLVISCRSLIFHND